MTGRAHRLRVVAAAVVLLTAATGGAGVDAAAAAPGVPAVAGVPAAAAAPRTVPCPDVLDGARCGSVRRPWDPTGAVPGTLGVGFVLVPASDASRPALGTVVAIEGGPGYATTSSAAAYADLFAPLLGRRNLLLVDQRGTGRSAPVDCPELQVLEGAYAPAAARCARRLGPRAHLFGSDLAADDLAAVVTALQVGPVDLYGDSYGTFLAQTFAGRHPDLLRTLTLDAAYPTFGEDAWYDTQAPALRSAMATACRRSAWCAGEGGSALRRFDRLLAEVRAHPLRGTAPGADGARHRVVVGAPTLAYVAFNATYVPTTYRELDAAVRAARAGDPLPLLRLAAEAQFPGGGVDAVEDYSEGLDAAVTCRDYPQLFDLTARPATRRAQLAASVATKRRTDPDVYAPFTIDEFLDSGWTYVDWCTDWPAPPAGYRPRPPRPPGGVYAPVPTLVLSGELDTITTPAEGRLVRSQFPRATWVQIPAALHVTAVGDLDGCASAIVVGFVRTTRTPSTACTKRLAPLRTAPPFWRTRAAAVPARPGPDSTRDRARLRAAAVAVATAGDATARWWQTFESEGLGLRGGTWAADGDEVVTVTLDRYRFSTDVPVSGTVVWDRRRGTVTATLVLTGSGASAGRLTARWDTRRAGAGARVTGTLGGRRVSGTVLAP
ncbi:MAG: alpha/beta hydrolase [Actinobacteria bacterium]|nr:alpha/beta hydrolase [Actinomycetota bacterium]